MTQSSPKRMVMSKAAKYGAIAGFIETYHILLSSITVILYVKEIFEKWKQIVSNNKKKGR